MRDDELLDALADALHADTPEVPPVDQRRVDALRAAVADQQTEPTPTPATPATTTPATTGGRNQWRPRLMAAAAVITVAAVAVGLALRWSQTGEVGEVEYAGPVSGPAGSGSLEVVKTGIGRVIDLETDDLVILPTGEYYEVWFVGPGDTPDSPNRISAGTFHPDADGRSNVTFAAAVDPGLLPRVEITAEPNDGDPRPSDEVVLEADLAG